MQFRQKCRAGLKSSCMVREFSDKPVIFPCRGAAGKDIFKTPSCTGIERDHFVGVNKMV